MLDGESNSRLAESGLFENYFKANFERITNSTNCSFCVIDMIRFTGCSLGSWSAGSSSACPLKLWTGIQQLGVSSGWLWLGCLQETAVWWGCGWLCTWPVTGPGTEGHCSYPQSPRHDTAPGYTEGKEPFTKRYFHTQVEQSGYFFSV